VSGAIRIAAALVVRGDGRALLVRKRGTRAFMQPGGKIAPGESATQALARELREELGCTVKGEPVGLGSFSAPAANEAGWIVEAELFAVGLAGAIEIGAEIEELAWVDPDAPGSVPLAPLTRDCVLPLVRTLRRDR
jgi:8-oxo-dGTP diphosphatase